MNSLSLKKAIIAALAVLLVVLPAACAPEAPPPPPPPPPAGTIAVEPAEIDYATLAEMWPVMAPMMGIPEQAIPVMNPAITILGIPIKFTGSGWPANELVSIELVLPAGVTVVGLMPGEDSIGIAFTTPDASGNFEVTLEPVAKLNWLLRTEWTPMMRPDMMSVDPLPTGTYTIKAVGLDPGTVSTTSIELGLTPPE